MTTELIIYIHEFRNGDLVKIEEISRPIGLLVYNPIWSLRPKYDDRKIHSLHVSDAGVHVYLEEVPVVERVILQEPAPTVTLSEQFVSSIPIENRGESRAEFEHDRFGQSGGTTDLYESSKGSSF